MEFAYGRARCPRSILSQPNQKVQHCLHLQLKKEIASSIVSSALRTYRTRRSRLLFCCGAPYMVLCVRGFSQDYPLERRSRTYLNLFCVWVIPARNASRYRQCSPSVRENNFRLLRCCKRHDIPATVHISSLIITQSPSVCSVRRIVHPVRYLLLQ